MWANVDLLNIWFWHGTSDRLSLSWKEKQPYYTFWHEKWLTHLLEGREGEEVSKKYYSESERESKPPIYLIWCHGILWPLRGHIHAPDAISHSYQWLQAWELHPSTLGDGNVPQRILNSLGLWPLSYSTLPFVFWPIPLLWFNSNCCKTWLIVHWTRQAKQR